MQKKSRILPQYTPRAEPLFGSFIANYRGFGKDARLLLTMSLSGALGGTTIWFILVLYLRELGFSPSFFGSILFLQGISNALVAIPAGRLSDFHGRKKPIIIGTFLSFLGVSFLVIPVTPLTLIVSALLMGNGAGFYTSAFSSLLADRTSPHKRKYLFSLQSISMLVGSAIAIMVSGALPDIFGRNGNAVGGYRLAIGIAASFMFLQFLLSLFIRDVEEKERPERSVPESLDLIIRFAIPMALIGLGAGMVMPFMQLHFAMRFGISPTSIGIVFATTQLSMILLIFALPRIAERKGSVMTAVHLESLATALMAILPVLAYLPFGFLLFTSVYIIRTIVINSVGPITSAFRMSVVKEEDRGITDATMGVVWIGFNSLGSLIGGYIMMLSLDLPFYIASAFYGLSVLTYYLFFRHMDDRTSRSASKSF